jgi:hypothetical protein
LVFIGSGLAAEFGGRFHVLPFPHIRSSEIDNIAYGGKFNRRKGRLNGPVTENG